MNKLVVSLITVCALFAGCAEYGAPRQPSVEAQKKPHEAVDRNRNTVPDALERKAVPLEPVINQPLKSVD
jgi:PBP1b-binding outer membrane lipoprotein LpoB